MKEIKCEFPRQIKYLQIATSLAREVCKTITNEKIDMEFIDLIELAVSEACTNAIQHATGIESKIVIVAFQIYKNKLVINVNDCGTGFDIDLIKSPNPSELQESGWGIQILKNIIDKLEYIKGADCNFLVMTKYF